MLGRWLLRWWLPLAVDIVGVSSTSICTPPPLGNSHVVWMGLIPCPAWLDINQAGSSHSPSHTSGNLRLSQSVYGMPLATGVNLGRSSHWKSEEFCSMVGEIKFYLVLMKWGDIRSFPTATVSQLQDGAGCERHCTLVMARHKPALKLTGPLDLLITGLINSFVLVRSLTLFLIATGSTVMVTIMGMYLYQVSGTSLYSKSASCDSCTIAEAARKRKKNAQKFVLHLMEEAIGKQNLTLAKMVGSSKAYKGTCFW